MVPARLQKYRGPIILLVLSLSITLLFAAWMGFNLTKIGEAPFGDRRDTVFERWVLYQAIDNLVHHPDDLGYAPIYYDDENSFGYTTATYAIALASMPIYFISGQNLDLTYNLYVLATYPLAALMGYFLIRYLVKVPPGIAIIAALMLAFTPHAFYHLPRNHQLSIYAYLLVLFCLHRLIDTKKWTWGLGLALSAWLVFMSSGYLGMITVSTCAVILLYVLIMRRMTWRLAGLLVISGLIAVVLLAPFVSFRLENEAFRVGQNARTMRSDVNILYNNKALLYSNLRPNGNEDAMFLGVVPTLIAVLALALRNKLDAQPDEERTLSTRDVLQVYGLVILAGFILALGTELRVAGNGLFPLPYELLRHLPGYSGMRTLGRFVVMPITGTSIFAAIWMARYIQHTRRTVYMLVLGLMIVVLVVERIPPNAYGRRGRDITGSFTRPLTQRMAYPTPLEDDRPWIDWLKDQPPMTPSLHIPVETEAGAHIFHALPEHHQPVLNGWGSFFPDWYTPLARSEFPSRQIIDLLCSRRIEYIFVHYNDMDEEGATEQRKRIADFMAVSDQIQLVESWLEVELYRLNAPDCFGTIIVDFSQPVSGEGWHNPERLPNGITMAWTNAPRATIVIDEPIPNPALLEFNVYRRITRPLLDTLRVSINGTPLFIQRVPTDDGNAYQAEIPPDVIPEGGPLELVFETDSVLRPSDIKESQDDRLLGVALSELTISEQK